MTIDFLFNRKLTTNPRGGDEIPPGTFHGGDEIPEGTFH